VYNKKGKAYWIGHIMPRNCIQKQVIKGKIEGKMEVTGRRRIRRRRRIRTTTTTTTTTITRTRRPKRLLDEIKETRAYWNLKEDVLCGEEKAN
jgi:hypothetical protein